MITTTKIENRAQWLKLRKGLVTASKAAALLGVHEFSTPYAYFCELSGLTPDPEDTPAMERGRLLEPVAIELLRLRYSDWTFYQPGLFYADHDRMIGCTPDLFGHNPKTTGTTNVQLKSVEPSVFRQKWHDEDGEIAIPLWIAVQSIFEASMTDCAHAAVAPLRVGHGVEIDILDVPMDNAEPLMRRLVDATFEMFDRVTRGDAPPINWNHDAEIVSQLYGKPVRGTYGDLSTNNRIRDLLDEHRAVMVAMRDLNKRRDACRAEIRMLCGDFERVRVGNDVTITNMVQPKGSYVVPASAPVVLKIHDKRPLEAVGLEDDIPS